MKSLLIGALTFVTYVTGAVMPIEWFWFDPGDPVFSDTELGQDPALTFSREIISEVAMSYAVILRDAETKEVACEAVGGPFTYLPEKSGPLLDKGLAWFAPSDPRCARLPVGTYYGEVTWTASYPLHPFIPEMLDSWVGWVIPPKSVTREIAPFKILPRNMG